MNNNSQNENRFQLRNKWESVISVTLTLFVFITLSIAIQVIFDKFLNDSDFYKKIHSHEQISNTIWTVQATVSVLCFFITNVITTIVKDSVFGVNIKDLLQARAGWFEISFWHQSMVCIILVLCNGLFVILNWVPAMLMLLILTFAFIIYMLHSAFEIVFSAELLQKRAKKIIYKEINTGKTILDMKQVVNTLELTILKNIDAKEQKQLSNNLDFLLSLYQTFSQSGKTLEKQGTLNSIINVGCKLVINNNYTYIQEHIITKIASENTDDFSILLQKLCKKVVNHFISFTDADVYETNVLTILLNWSNYLNNKVNTNFFADVFLDYYKDIKINSNLSIAIKNNLITDFFQKLIMKHCKNQPQLDLKKITILNLVKYMIIHNNLIEDFSILIANIYSFYATKKDETKEIIICIISYLYYLSHNSIYNESLFLKSQEFMNVMPPVASGYSECLTTHLKTSNGKYLNYFWKILKLYQDYDLQNIFGMMSDKNILDDVLSFYMNYWKLNSSSLINIDFKNLYNQPNFKIILDEIIQVIKTDKTNSYKNLKGFCEWLAIDFKMLTEDNSWSENTNKIDEYLNEIYLNNILNSTSQVKTRLNIIGTKRLENEAVLIINERLEKLPFLNKKTSALFTPQKECMNIVVKNSDLIGANQKNTVLANCSKNFKDNFSNLIFDHIYNQKNLKEIKFKTEKDNVAKLIKLINDYNITSYTHYLSNNIDVINHNAKEDLDKLIELEHKLQFIEEMQTNQYLYLNGKEVQIFAKVLTTKIIEPDEKTIVSLLKDYEVKPNVYSIENISTNKTIATEYIKNTYAVLSINFHYILNISENSGFLLQI